MPNTRWNHTATLLPNGRVLVAGGTTNQQPVGTNVLASADLYNPVTGTWSKTSPMKNPRIFHTAIMLPNGKILVTGGTSNYPTMYLSISEIYEPNTGTWSTNEFMNFARYLHSAILLNNGQVLVAGGYGSSGILSSAEIYTSSNAPVMPINLVDQQITADKVFRFAFTNTPDMSFIVYGATNLSVPSNNWVIIDGLVENIPGNYLLTGFNITNSPQWFFRVRAP